MLSIHNSTRDRQLDHLYARLAAARSERNNAIADSGPTSQESFDAKEVVHDIIRRIVEWN